MLWHFFLLDNALHEVYRVSPCFRRVWQGAADISWYRESRNIARDFVTAPKLSSSFIKQTKGCWKIAKATERFTTVCTHKSSPRKNTTMWKNIQIYYRSS